MRMRELKPKCAARIFFDFFWAFMAPGSNNYKCGVDYSVDRERKIREGEEGTLAACLHFRFFTPRLGFDCGLSGSKQPPAAVANLSMYLALDTWPGEREREERKGGARGGEYTLPGTAGWQSHSFLLELEFI